MNELLVDDIVTAIDPSDTNHWRILNDYSMKPLAHAVSSNDLGLIINGDLYVRVINQETGREVWQSTWPTASFDREYECYFYSADALCEPEVSRGASEQEFLEFLEEG